MRSNDARITRITGRGITIRGDDIDTDQILPARHLKAVTFQGMEAFAFDDLRVVSLLHGPGRLQIDNYNWTR